MRDFFESFEMMLNALDARKKKHTNGLDVQEFI